jgi:hypothetical protein
MADLPENFCRRSAPSPIPAVASRRTELSKVSTHSGQYSGAGRVVLAAFFRLLPMRDWVADWNRWSRAERLLALFVAFALFALPLSMLLTAATAGT